MEPSMKEVMSLICSRGSKKSGFSVSQTGRDLRNGKQLALFFVLIPKVLSRSGTGMGKQISVCLHPSHSSSSSGPRSRSWSRNCPHCMRIWVKGSSSCVTLRMTVSLICRALGFGGTKGPIFIIDSFFFPLSACSAPRGELIPSS